MSTIGYHVVIKLRDGRVIAPTPMQRRVAAVRVLEICRELRLVAFHLVDSHLHLLLLETYPVAMRAAWRIEVSLRARLRIPVSFDRAFPEPVRDQRHLYNAFDYVLRQQSRHGLDWDPYLDACGVVDLLGLRTVGAYMAAHVRAYLPRVGRDQLLGYLGVDELEPGSGPLELLPAACTAAAGLTSLGRTSAGVRAAICAGVAVAGRDTPAPRLAPLLSCSVRTLARRRKLEAEPLLVDAVRKQLFLRATKPLAAEGSSSP